MHHLATIGLHNVTDRWTDRQLTVSMTIADHQFIIILMHVTDDTACISTIGSSLASNRAGSLRPYYGNTDKSCPAVRGETAKFNRSSTLHVTDYSLCCSAVSFDWSRLASKYLLSTSIF